MTHKVNEFLDRVMDYCSVHKAIKYIKDRNVKVSCEDMQRLIYPTADKRGLGPCKVCEYIGFDAIASSCSTISLIIRGLV